MGFAGIYVKSDVGGSEMSRLDAAIIMEELSAGCTSTAAFISIHNMASWMIDRYASEAQRRRFLPSLTTMEKIASYCLTEPGSGSDAAALKTRAVKDGDDYVLNGSKAFISGAGTSDVYVCMVRTGEDGPKGISCLVVEKGMKGLSFGKKERKMGWNSQPTAQVIFEDCRVPIANRIGAEGEGLPHRDERARRRAASISERARWARRARRSRRPRPIVGDRKQFGRAIADFQATQFKLADMATELEASRLMIRSAARRARPPRPARDHAVRDGQALRHRRGLQDRQRRAATPRRLWLSERLPAERHVRDLRVHQILEGTNEIMRVIVSREMFRQ